MEVASLDVAERSEEFEEAAHGGHINPPLPPDDRLWRHPSELGNERHSIATDPAAVRRRWLQSEQTRASAWTAGVVGALLATGLVALGTHLAGALTGGDGASAPSSLSNSPTAAATISATPGRLSGAVSPDLLGRIEQVSAAVAVLDVSRGRAEFSCLGLVVRSDGMLLVPASVLTYATSVTASVGGVDGYVGTVVGIDEDSGVAVVRINPVHALPTIPSVANVPGTGTLALAITGGAASSYSLGTIHSTDASPTIDGVRLVDAVTTDLPVGPDGSPVLDSHGNVVGMVVGHAPSGEIVSPAWVANPVANELITRGGVAHGSIGIVGSTASPRGVRVVRVEPKSPAAAARLRPTDLIVSVAGKPVRSMVALHGALYGYAPGTTISLVVRRPSGLTRIRLTLGVEPTP